MGRYSLRAVKSLGCSSWNEGEQYQDPTLRPFTSRSRVRPESSSLTREIFVTQTLHTPDTILSYQSFFKAPTLSKLFEVIYLLKLGLDLNGHYNLAHGGFVLVVLHDVINTTIDYERLTKNSIITAYFSI